MGGYTQQIPKLMGFPLGFLKIFDAWHMRELLLVAAHKKKLEFPLFLGVYTTFFNFCPLSGLKLSDLERFRIFLLGLENFPTDPSWKEQGL